MFNSDIKNLLIMADMWKSRSPPTPLDYISILDGTFQSTNTASGKVTPENAVASGSGLSEKTSPSSGSANGASSTSHLKDQRALTLKDNLELFISRYA